MTSLRIPNMTYPARREDLLRCLNTLHISHTTTDHAPVFTVAEGQDIKAALPSDHDGAHTKNLFVKDKAGQFFLICAQGDTPIRLNRLPPVLGSKRLSFAKPEALLDILGVTPGSVTLFALINDRDHQVSLILDESLTRHDIVNFHPLRNDATTAISSQDMIRFAQASGHIPTVIDFHALAHTLR